MKGFLPSQYYLRTFFTMFLPRRRSTSLVLAIFVSFSVWYCSRIVSKTLAPKLGEQGPIRDAWFRDVSLRHPILRMTRLPLRDRVEIPQIQHNFRVETIEAKAKREERLAAIKSSFEHSWRGYEKYAWLKDELRPVTGEQLTSFGGWAATLVDTLDALWLMGTEEEFARAVKAMTQIDFTTTESNELNVFETTIRYLGGLLGAYDISNGTYPVLLRKATEIGDLLSRSFDTPNHMPLTRWHWKSSRRGEEQEASESTLIAEIGSLELEFTRLSQLTGDLKYFDLVERVMTELHKAQTKTEIPGLWPTIVDAKHLTFTGSGFTLGGMADSLYEYLPKQHLLLGGFTEQYKEMYELAMIAVKNYIFFRPMLPDDKDILVSGSATVRDDQTVEIDSRGQHLGCFTGGMVGIGAKIFDRPEELTIARKLVDGCIWAYDSMITGIMPEVFHMVRCEDPLSCEWDEKKWHEAIGSFDHVNEDVSTDGIGQAIKKKRLPKGFSDISDRRYILRPEAIESVFILYRITGDTTLQDAAWRMFQAIEKHTRTSIANSAISDVTVSEPPKDNRMESFWLAETLKYFYLIFSEPNLLSLDEFVLNTEAHPLRRPV